MKNVDYYFCLNSPWSRYASIQLLKLKADLDLNLHLKPINIMRLFSEIGILPVGQRTPAMQQYRLDELARWSKRLALPINLKPAFFPCDESKADAIVLSAEQQKGLGLEVAAALSSALWADEANLADPEFIDAQIAKYGLTEVMGADECREIVEANTDELIERNGIGVPTCYVGDQMFFGQDRLDFVVDALR